jgi:hypothetical protein
MDSVTGICSGVFWIMRIDKCVCNPYKLKSFQSKWHCRQRPIEALGVEGIESCGVTESFQSGLARIIPQDEETRQ